MDLGDSISPEKVNQYSRQLAANIEIAKRQLSTAEKLKTDYSQVHQLLENITHKICHQIMIPLGPLAFIPGELVHTNELTVLLGENWFVERSAHQASEIMNRRTEYLQTQIDSLNGDLSQLETRAGISRELFGTYRHESDTLGEIVEIKEAYESDEEKAVEPAPISEVAFVKTTEEQKEDEELLKFMNQLYLDEQNGLLEDEEEASLGSESEKEDEDENYQEGRIYCSRGQDESEDEQSLDSEYDELETTEAISSKKLTSDKKVRFSESVSEPSSRTPIEFRSNPLWKMLNQINNSETEVEPLFNPTVVTPDQLRLSKDIDEDASKKNAKILASKVVESEVPTNIDPDVLEQSIDLQVIAEEYQRRRQERIMTQGGYSVTPEELEMREYNKYSSDDTPVLWKGEIDPDSGIAEESSVTIKPRRVSRFKAARLAERK